MSDEVKLPEPATPRMGIFPDRYTVDQLRAYGEACRQDEREKCIEICRNMSDAAYRSRDEAKSEKEKSEMDMVGMQLSNACYFIKRIPTP